VDVDEQKIVKWELTEGVQPLVRSHYPPITKRTIDGF